MRHTHVISAAGFLLLALGSSAMAQMVDPNARFGNMPLITTTGYAHAIRVPDEVTVLIGASANGATSDEALQSVGVKVKALAALVKANNFANADIQSTGPTTEVLYKHFYDQSGRELYDKRQPIGFSATYSLSVKTTSIDATGPFLPKVTAAGGLINNISFAVSDERSLRSTLSNQAIADAVAKAKQAIAAASAKPGRILQIGDNTVGEDGQADLNRPVHAEPYTRDFGFALQPGQVDITVEQRIVMEILPQ